MKSCFVITLCALLLFPALTLAQTIVNVPSDFGVGEGSLNNAIATAIGGGTLSNTVFQLEQYGLYILSGTITVPMGQHLTIVGPAPGTDQNSAPAQIVWTASSGPTKNFNFDCYGDITLKNVGGTRIGTRGSWHLWQVIAEGSRRIWATILSPGNKSRALQAGQ